MKRITTSDLHKAKIQSAIGGWVENEEYKRLKMEKEMQDFEDEIKKEVKI